MDTLADTLKNAPQDQALALCSTLIGLIHQTCLKHNVKIFDNYNFRTIAMGAEVKKAIWDDFEMPKKRTGVDGFSKKYNLKDIECKTYNDDGVSNPLKSSFMWDKQSEEVRRKKTLASDAFVLGRFEKEMLKIILVAEDKATLEHIVSIMKERQTAFLAKWNKNIEDGKRGGSDAIRLSYDDILKGDHVWHIYVNGQWHKNKKSQECATLITSQQT